MEREREREKQRGKKRCEKNALLLVYIFNYQGNCLLYSKTKGRMHN